MNKVTTIAAALIMGFTFSAFAGTPKGETKTEATEAKTESPAESTGETSQGTIAWFPISSPGVRTDDDPIDPDLLCTGNNTYCAQLYNVNNNGEPTTPVSPAQTRRKQ